MLIFIHCCAKLHLLATTFEIYEKLSALFTFNFTIQLFSVDHASRLKKLPSSLSCLSPSLLFFRSFFLSFPRTCVATPERRFCTWRSPSFCAMCEARRGIRDFCGDKICGRVESFAGGRFFRHLWTWICSRFRDTI